MGLNRFCLNVVLLFDYVPKKAPQLNSVSGPASRHARFFGGGGGGAPPPPPPPHDQTGSVCANGSLRAQLSDPTSKNSPLLLTAVHNHTGLREPPSAKTTIKTPLGRGNTEMCDISLDSKISFVCAIAFSNTPSHRQSRGSGQIVGKASMTRLRLSRVRGSFLSSPGRTAHKTSRLV